MSERESIYDRLHREQQAKAQHVLLWYGSPLLAVVLVWFYLANPDGDWALRYLTFGVLSAGVFVTMLGRAAHKRFKSRDG